MIGRFDLTDREWAIIEPLLPNKPRSVPRVDDRTVLNGIFLGLAHRRAVGRHALALRAAHHCLQPLQSLAQSRRVGAYSQAFTG